MDMGPGGIYQIYGQGGAPLGGMFNKPDEMPGPPMWLYYVSVDDVNIAVERVVELGGQVLNGPMEVPDGDLIAQCVDPQGALFALHSKS
jgi:predicted enzyme related to lactoylglutathione lyase